MANIGLTAADAGTPNGTIRWREGLLLIHYEIDRPKPHEPHDEKLTFQAESVRGAIHLKSVIGWGFIAKYFKWLVLRGSARQSRSTVVECQSVSSRRLFRLRESDTKRTPVSKLETRRPKAPRSRFPPQ